MQEMFLWLNTTDQIKECILEKKKEKKTHVICAFATF